MKTSLHIMIIFVTLPIAAGCATTKRQDSKSASSAQAISETPVTIEQTQPITETEKQSNVLPVGALKARQCIIQVLQEIGETVIDSTDNTNEIVTRFKFVSYDKLQKIASIPEQKNKIKLERGGYNLRLHIYPASENSTVLEISIRILGNLETSLPLLRPSTYQPLPSRGTLEQEIYNAILKCCQEKDK
ncbi:MAG TPA: hypothetical protein ACFYDZ_05885 [Candidatus Brocadiaceae bacterium]